MAVVEGVPLFSVLSKVDRAKLISDLVSVELRPGEWQEFRPDDQMLSFIKDGRVEVGVRVEERWVGLVTLGAGEVLGDGISPDEAYPLGFRSLGPVELVRLNRERFEALLTEHPRMLQQFNRLVLDRNRRILQELARSKAMLMAYAAELWSTVGEQSGSVAEETSASAMVPPAVLEVTRSRTGPPVQTAFGRFAAGWAILVAALSGWLSHTAGFASSTALSLGILVWAVLNWLLDTLPDHVVAMAVAGAASLLALVPTEVAFGGFANKTWILLLAVLGIAHAVSKTGLLYRLALHMLRRLPPTYFGQSTALSLVGLVLAPFLPGVTGRQAMASRLALELAEAMRFRNYSRGSAGLAMSCFVAGSCLYFVSMTGGSVTLLVLSYMPNAIKAGITWGGWLLAALPATIVVFGLTTLAILRLYRPEHRDPVPRDLVADQLSVLGPLSAHERATLCVVSSLVLSFVTQPFHHLDPTWVALGGFLFLISAGVIDKEGLRKGIDWPFMLLTGGLLGIAAISEQTGLVRSLGSLIVPLIHATGASNSWILLPAVALLTVAVRVFLPFHSAILLMTLALTPVAVQLGYNPFAIGLVILIMSSHFYIPQGNPMYMAAYAGGDQRAFTHRQVRVLAVIHAATTLLAVLVSIPYWQWLGLIPW